MSAKQHREYLKLQSREQREVAKMQAEQKRKQQLHEIKLQEAAAKAKQGIGHKEDIHAVRLNEMGSPLGKSPRMNKQKLGIPSQNPLAGTGVLNRGQKKLYAEGTDTVPAMLTPGEAVIPAPAAQNPENKAVIRRMVEEGRKENALRDGTMDVPGYYNGTTDVNEFEAETQRLKNQPVPPAPVVEQPKVDPNEFFRRTSYAEAGNDPYAKQKQPGQTAAGLTGTTKGTFGLFQKKYPELQGIEFGSKEYYDPKFQEKLSNLHVQDRIPQITNKGLPVNYNTLYAAGFGPNGIKAYAGKDDEPLSKYFTKEELKNNKYFGNTVGEYKLFVNDKMDKAEQQLQKSVVPTGRETMVAKPDLSSQIPLDEPRVSVPVVSLPTGREVMIAKQDLATSTNPAVRKKAEAVLAAANQGIPTLADNRNTIKAVPVINPVGNSGKVNSDLERSKELANDPTLSANDRAFFEQEVKRLSGEPFKPVGAAAPQERAKQLTGDTVTVPKVIPEPVTNTEVPAPEVPAPEVQQTPSLLETKPQEANKAIAEVSQSKADIIQGFLNDPVFNQIQEPEEKKSWLERAISSVFGPTGVFSNAELARFAVVAAGGLLTGGSVGGSLKYAGIDALKAADARRAAQATRANEELKNTRELNERLDSDYRTALGENVPAAVRARAIELYQGAKTPDQKRAVIQLLKMNKSPTDTMGTGKPTAPNKGFFDGKPIEFRNQAGNVQRVVNGEWVNIPPSDLKRFETKADYNDNKKKMIDSTVNRITPVLKRLNAGDKNYNAKDEAQAIGETFSLIKEELGPNISETSFAKMTENTIKSAEEYAKANGTQLTEEGLRKAFFGNAVIETKMVTGNKEMYMAKNNKGKFTLPSAPYQTALGTALETYKKQGIDLGEASNAIENKFNKLPAETKKKFTQMSAGAPGSTPMLLWLQQTGGAD